MQTVIIVTICVAFIVLIVSIVEYIVRKKKKIPKGIGIMESTTEEFKHTYNIEQARKNFEQCSPLTDQEQPELLKDTIDRVTKKSKDIKISNVLTGLKENAEKREEKFTPREVANKISAANFIEVEDEEQFWEWVDKQVAKMTDEERGELQELVNRNKV